MNRRLPVLLPLALSTVALMLLFSFPCWAGPYLNTSTMLLVESDHAGRWVRTNLGDKELAKNAQKMAQARLDVASTMVVPPEVREAHPHLLLALAAMERAMQAAIDGRISDFIRQIQTSSGEAKTFQAVLQAAGFTLPNYHRAAAPSAAQPRHAEATEKLDPPAALQAPRRFRSPKTARRGERLRAPRTANDTTGFSLLLNLPAS